LFWHKVDMYNTIFKLLMKMRGSPRSQIAGGFTLIEVLVTALIGSIMVVALTGFSVNLLQADRQEAARSDTQREMDQALAFMADEVREGVYVYESECLQTSTADPFCPGLTNRIIFPAGMTPILAFWKLEPINSSDLPALPTSTTDPNYQLILDLRTSRNNYTLVIYSLDTNPTTPTYEGPATLTRYELRQFPSLPALTQTPGFVRPYSVSATGQDEVSFRSWPCQATDCSGAGSPITTTRSDHAVLVDRVDNLNRDTQGRPTSTETTNCPTTYSTSAATATKGFYSCVRRPDETAIGGVVQDVALYLRGNALERANIAEPAPAPAIARGDMPSYLPKLRTQVQTRSVFQRTPPDLKD
jgi:prepilin-type N-terminal cleavage/methylation domain-containing protein